MKFTKKFFICLILVFGTLFCLSACGSNESSTIPETNAVKLYITGRYELEEIQWASGITASGETLQSSEDAMGDMYVELYSDYTAQLSLYGLIMDMEYSDNEMKQVNSTFNTYEFSVSSGRVTLKKDGDTFIFVKK